jgi:hypothetical protein
MNFGVGVVGLFFHKNIYPIFAIQVERKVGSYLQKTLQFYNLKNEPNNTKHRELNKCQLLGKNTEIGLKNSEIRFLSEC